MGLENVLQLQEDPIPQPPEVDLCQGIGLDAIS